MARVFNVVSSMDMDLNFQELYSTLMAMLMFIMVLSLFSYRSLLTSIIMLYSSYITMVYHKEIKKYVKRKLKKYKPVLAPYKIGFYPLSDSDIDEGYEEECDDTDHKHSE